MSTTSKTRYESIRLPDRWQGRVATGVQPFVRDSGPGSGEPAQERSLPTAEQWSSWLAQLVRAPASLPGYAPLKYSKHGQVFRARFATGAAVLDVVCKQSCAHGLVRGAIARLRPTRERANFARAIALLEVGIRTAPPLAQLERRVHTPEGWLVTCFVDGLVDLDQVALNRLQRAAPSSRPRIKRAISRAVVDFLIALEENGLAHRDVKASNILLKNWDGETTDPSVWLVDLDGLRQVKRWRIARPSQPTMRLAASLLGYRSITRTDYARFLKHYVARTTHANRPVRRDWRLRFRELARAAKAYRLRSTRRKSHKLDGYTGDT